MKALLTKQETAEFLRFDTVVAAEKFLASLGVPKLDRGLAGSKGVLYRLADIKYALEKIEVKPKGKSKKRKRRPRKSSNIFDLPISEQVMLLTKDSPSQ